MQGRLGRQELLEQYSDPGWRQAYVRASSLVDLLENCVLRKGYKIPDLMISPLAFTPAGIELRDHLITKQQVPPKEAKMLCFLALAHREPLIDFASTTSMI